MDEVTAGLIEIFANAIYHCELCEEDAVELVDGKQYCQKHFDSVNTIVSIVDGKITRK